MSTFRPGDEPMPGDPAIGVDTFVREVQGQWVVEIAVVFPDGGVTHTIDTYRTRRHAEIAASWIKRGAQRDIQGPLHG